MNDEQKLEPPDDDLERYLDGLLSSEEEQAFLESQVEESLVQTVELDQQINDSLRSMFGQTQFDAEKENAAGTEGETDAKLVLPNHDALEGSAKPLWSQRALRLATVAVLLVAIGVGVWLLVDPGGQIEPDFVPRSLTKLYQESVDGGFRPYYNCDDDQRFANTFKERLGVPLRLTTLPAESHMLGLWYPGGISRWTTAVLFVVDGTQVIVFVDRSNADGIDAAKLREATDKNLFVVEKEGLVFCEVSPLNEAKMIPYLEKSER